LVRLHPEEREKAAREKWDEVFLQIGVEGIPVLMYNALNKSAGFYLSSLGMSSWSDSIMRHAKRGQTKIRSLAESVLANANWAIQTAAAWNAVAVCPYVPGDVNCNGECRGSDITYLVSALGGSSPAKPNCLCTDLNNVHTAFWVTADYNGDCQIMGSDVTYGVRYFKGLGPAPVPCSDFPPN
jgi:hypothetical protein